MPIEHIQGKQFRLIENHFIAHLDYNDHNGIRTITHTIVPAELSGRGIASQLAHAALDDARIHHLRIRSQCSFIDYFINKTPQYQDLLV